MLKNRICGRFNLCALALSVLLAGSALGSASAAAAELSDYLWKHRPLLLFAPADSDPRLVETLGRIDADLQAIYAVVDGMPMRSREMRTGPSRC